MTEQFDMIETETDWIIRDNKIGMTREEVVALLNLYKRENEQLKQQLNDCTDWNTKLINENEDLNYLKCKCGSLEEGYLKLQKENEQLKHNNKMLSMKMSEVSTKYRLLKEFSDDTNPNEAVKTVLHELMMITKEYR